MATVNMEKHVVIYMWIIYVKGATVKSIDVKKGIPENVKYWREYRSCKFNEFCSYSHKEEHNTEKAASDLEHMKSEIDIIAN